LQDCHKYNKHSALTDSAMGSLSSALSMMRRLSRSQLMPRPATATLPSSAKLGGAEGPSWCASVVSSPWLLGVSVAPVHAEGVM
jgi:hypothetical protein